MNFIHFEAVPHWMKEKKVKKKRLAQRAKVKGTAHNWTVADIFKSHRKSISNDLCFQNMLSSYKYYLILNQLIVLCFFCVQFRLCRLPLNLTVHPFRIHSNHLENWTWHVTVCQLPSVNDCQKHFTTNKHWNLAEMRIMQLSTFTFFQ